MKKYLLAAFLALIAPPAFAQCNGLFDAGKVCGNDTASPRAPHPMSLPTINLNGLGAKSDFSTDNAPIINAAIAAHPNGVILTLDPGTGYCIDSPILMGNGTNAVPVSTINGTQLAGAGGASFLTVINWCGGSLTGSAMVKVSGENGWGIKGVWLAGPGTTGTALQVVASDVGEVDDLTVNNVLVGVAVKSFQNGGQTAGNRWSRVSVDIPNVANAIGVSIDGNGIDNTTNSCCDTWDNLSANFSGGTNVQTGIYIRDVDTEYFNQFICNNAGSNATIIVLDFTGQSSGGWPENITFSQPQFGCGTAAQYGQIGTPTSFAMNSNRIFADGSNGTIYSYLSGWTHSPNLMPPGIDTAGRTSGFSNFLTAATLLHTGMYRVCGYLEVTTTGVGGATLSETMAWVDDTGTTQATTVVNNIATSAKNQGNGCVAMRAVAGTNISGTVTVTGTIGAAVFSAYMRLERLD